MATVPAHHDTPTTSAKPPSNGGGNMATVPATVDRLRRITLVRDKAMAAAGSRRATLSERVSEDDLAEQLGGDIVARGVIRAQLRVPFNALHGAETIRPPASDLLARFRGGDLNDVAASPPSPRLIALDTETTGLSAGTGTVAFLVGLAWFDAEALIVDQWLLTRFAGEEKLLEGVRDELSEADLLLTYNGKSYDMPLLETRRRLNARTQAARRQSTWQGEHLDLLHAVRRTFKHRWDDCRLTSVERHLFDYHRRGDIPSEDIPDVWARWLRFGDARDLTRVVSHNRDDLVTLALLPTVLAEAQDAPRDSGASAAAAAEEHLRNGRPDAALAHLSMHEASLAAPGRHLFADTARRAGDYPTAVRLWTNLAERADETALLSLAKYYEHVAKDLRAALTACERLLTIATSKSERDEYSHRRGRLVRKLEGAGDKVSGGRVAKSSGQ